MTSLSNTSHADESQLQIEIEALREENHVLSGKVKQLVLTEHNLYTSRNQLDSQVQTYQKLYELGKSFNKTFDPIEVLNLATYFVLYELEFERCLILLFDKLENRFITQSFDGFCETGAETKVREFSLAADADILQRLAADKDYDICSAVETDDCLCDWRLPIGMHEYIIFLLRHEGDVPLGLLIAGNTQDRATYHTRVEAETEGFLGLANAASQITTAIKALLN